VLAVNALASLGVYAAVIECVPMLRTAVGRLALPPLSNTGAPMVVAPS
jgi:hypothetical protein